MIHIYTGDGKGKTTAAIGILIRAIGAGYRPIMMRFMKTSESSEDSVLKDLDVPVEYFGVGFIWDEIPEGAAELVNKGLRHLGELIKEGRYNFYILDEINIAVDFGLVSDEEVLNVINEADENVEIILTGRGATEKLKERADLVTEMKMIKHYFNEGLKARKGIEY